MRGYAKQTSEFSTMYRMLPGMLEGLGGTALSFFRVGNDIDPLPAQFFGLVLSPIFYCPPSIVKQGVKQGGHGPLETEYIRSRCFDSNGQPTTFNKASRIDKAIDRIVAEHRQNGINLAIVVTDLFVSTQELMAGLEAGFRDGIGRALRLGLSIGVLAIEAPYNDTIYDLPSYSANDGPRHSGTRPFFALVFGPTGQIQALEDGLRTEFGKTKRRYESVVFRPFVADHEILPAINPVANVEPTGQIDPDVFAGFDSVLVDIHKRFGSVVPFPLMTLPEPRSPRWQPISAQLELPSILRDARLASSGRVEMTNEETLVFSSSRGSACAGSWKQVWNNKSNPLTTPSGSDRISVFRDREQAKSFERATRGMGKLFMHRVSLRWVPNPPNRSLGNDAGPSWITDFGFRADDERPVLEQLREPPLRPGQRPGTSGTFSLPQATKGFFPALNLPELITTLSRVERNLQRPVDLGHFVVVWRYEN
jgi:hypothetical protein